MRDPNSNVVTPPAVDVVGPSQATEAVLNSHAAGVVAHSQVPDAVARPQFPAAVVISQVPDAVVLLQELPAAGGRRIGQAILNVPKALHALNPEMIALLDTALQRWASDPAIACVVLRSSTDKAFCAGGDVRSLRSAILAEPGVVPNPQAQAFFSAEYRLDYRIHTYPKPLLVWGNGIVMGGGLGLLAGASHRVVCDNTRIAMPETAIGLFPDVGGSWFLPRMPGRTGLFLGLTGAAMNAQDAVFAGLGDYVIAHQAQAEVMAALCRINWDEQTIGPGERDGQKGHEGRVEGADEQKRSNPQKDVAGEQVVDAFALLDAALQPFCLPAASLPSSSLRTHFDVISAMTAGHSLAQVIESISGYEGDDVWLQGAAQAVQRAAPSSLALVWALQERPRHLGLADVFRLELVLALRCCAYPDFAEGVRALLVDKDQAPQWQHLPAAGSVAHAALLDEFFTVPWPQHPLADLV